MVAEGEKGNTQVSKCRRVWKTSDCALYHVKIRKKGRAYGPVVPACVGWMSSETPREQDEICNRREGWKGETVRAERIVIGTGMSSCVTALKDYELDGLLLNKMIRTKRK